MTGAVLADNAGNCTATPINLTAGGGRTRSPQNDFMANGGDGYPNFASRMTTQDIMEQVVADYVTAHSPLTPVVKAAPNGRINCTDTNGADGAELSDVDRVPLEAMPGWPAAICGGPPTALPTRARRARPSRRARATPAVVLRRRVRAQAGSRGCR